MTVMALRERFRALSESDAADPRLRLKRGTAADYRALAGFHYRSSRPGAITRVERLVHETPTIVGRYLGRRSDTTLVGVLVSALPHLACAGRDRALPGRYTALSRRDRAIALNREVRTIARVVIHPQWRGLGLAVRLVRHALDHPEPGVRYTEALAAMGRVHPFFEKAGMTRYDLPLRPEHARLLDALDRLGLDATWLASPRALRVALLERPEVEQVWFEHELARWHRHGARRSRRRSRWREPLDIDVDTMLCAARDRVLSQPVYYVWVHGARG